MAATLFYPFLVRSPAPKGGLSGGTLVPLQPEELHTTTIVKNNPAQLLSCNGGQAGLQVVQEDRAGDKEKTEEQGRRDGRTGTLL